MKWCVMMIACMFIDFQKRQVLMKELEGEGAFTLSKNFFEDLKRSEVK